MARHKRHDSGKRHGDWDQKTPVEKAAELDESWEKSEANAKAQPDQWNRPQPQGGGGKSGTPSGKPNRHRGSRG